MLHFWKCIYIYTHTPLHPKHLEFTSVRLKKYRVHPGRKALSSKKLYICQKTQWMKLSSYRYHNFFVLSDSCNINKLTPLKDSTNSCRILLNIPWGNGCCRTIKITEGYSREVFSKKKKKQTPSKDRKLQNDDIFIYHRRRKLETR